MPKEAKEKHDKNDTDGIIVLDDKKNDEFDLGRDDLDAGNDDDDDSDFDDDFEFDDGGD
jgi:hypothetical protein